MHQNKFGTIHLKNNADPNLTDQKNYIALHFSVIFNQTLFKIVRLHYPTLEQRRQTNIFYNLFPFLFINYYFTK